MSNSTSDQDQSKPNQSKDDSSQIKIKKSAKFKLGKVDPADILHFWKKLKGLPAGKTVFSHLVGKMAPYTGSIKPHIEELGSGFCLAKLRDRKAVRNHLKSIHAIALVNISEVSSGLATMAAMPKGGRGILTGFSIEYLKKARGTISATTDFKASGIGELSIQEQNNFEVPVVLTNEAGEVVAKAKAQWTIGPKPKKS